MWRFLDFVVTHRPSIFLLLQPFIEFKVSSGPKVINFFSMLNLTEHDISTAHKKTKILTKKEVSCFKSLRSGIYHAKKC